MKIYLCDLCGTGFDREFSDEIILRHDEKGEKVDTELVYYVCPSCAELVKREVTRLVVQGKLKRDKVVAVAINAMDELY